VDPLANKARLLIVDKSLVIQAHQFMVRVHELEEYFQRDRKLLSLLEERSLHPLNGGDDRYAVVVTWEYICIPCGLQKIPQQHQVCHTEVVYHDHGEKVGTQLALADHSDMLWYCQY
jgi:hypothetical protein